ncbi:hypothetical protein [Priestia filamentosa]|uniref:Uncharacterized protein n=1 Tax=Priestia filamentosa TaxID=1402861 RepID=A0A0H4KBD6_9BACI|nr:hypothetical protein [Priestia filamentosa]AKO90925.1 hypothetical protein BEH_01510 [Priestia filamentosa]AVD54264.1 hypothetical protein CKF96_01510 [Priestia filamentosa]RJS65719.1 hypothetical protein CJ485_13600 [Priestia filamentosa]
MAKKRCRCGGKVPRIPPKIIREFPDITLQISETEDTQLKIVGRVSYNKIPLKNVKVALRDSSNSLNFDSDSLLTNNSGIFTTTASVLPYVADDIQVFAPIQYNGDPLSTSSQLST